MVDFQITPDFPLSAYLRREINIRFVEIIKTQRVSDLSKDLWFLMREVFRDPFEVSPRDFKLGANARLLSQDTMGVIS